MPLFNVDFLNIDTGMTMDQINEHTDSFQFSDSSHPDYCAISHDFSESATFAGESARSVLCLDLRLEVPFSGRP